MGHTRFAIYFLPSDGPLADFGASWLGWDVAAGCVVRQPDVLGLGAVTQTPRKYGFHGTLKPPFRLAHGQSVAALTDAVSDLAAQLASVQCDGLTARSLGHFLALTPQGDMADLRRLAAACVRDLDLFRAPALAREIARRRTSGLSPRQDALLTQWGYPFVMDEFRFHMTLTGRLAHSDMGPWLATVQHHLPVLPAPFVLDQIALCGEREDGCFELIQRFSLTG